MAALSADSSADAADALLAETSDSSADAAREVLDEASSGSGVAAKRLAAPSSDSDAAATEVLALGEGLAASLENIAAAFRRGASGARRSSPNESYGGG